MTTDLSIFPATEKIQLIALFYRVGIWISQVDDDGADAADATEEATLERLLANVASNKNRCQLVREIAGEALRQKGNWPRWQENLDGFIAEAQDGVRLLRPVCSPAELTDFIVGLRALAEAVAMANHEESTAADNDGADLKPGLFDRLKALLPAPKLNARNISPVEDDALTELARALKQV